MTIARTMLRDQLLRGVALLAFSLAVLTRVAAGQTDPTILPSTPGMYVATSSGLVKILGQIVSFQRTGSVVASGLTAGLVSRKNNVQLLGQHAQTMTGPTPVFYFVPSKQEAEAGGSGGDLVLLRAEPNLGSLTAPRRQFEISAQGYGRASTGISITHQIELLRSEESPGVYKLTPTAALAGGEYLLFLERGEGMAPYVYDFSVQGLGNFPNIVLSDKSTVPAADILRKAKNCPSLSIITQSRRPEFEYTLEAAETKDHRSGFEFFLFNPHGDKDYDATGDHLDAAIENLCHAITGGTISGGITAQPPDAPNDKGQNTPSAPAKAPELSAADASALATILVSSNPDAAEIYVDSAFVGNAPAMLKLTAGKHTIKLMLAGYEDWSRDITALTGSEAHLMANFQKR